MEDLEKHKMKARMMRLLVYLKIKLIRKMKSRTMKLLESLRIMIRNLKVKRMYLESRRINSKRRSRKKDLENLEIMRRFKMKQLN